MSEIPQAQPAPSYLDLDVLCIGCGYNLRGAEPSGRCPECGLSVADSTRGNLLAYAEAGWLRRIKAGTTLKLWNIVITIFGTIILGMLIGILGVPPAFLIALFPIGAILGLLATICITSQEPRIVLTEDPVTLRKLIRACAVFSTFASIPGHFVDSANVQGIPILDAEWFWEILSVLTGLTALVVFFGELKYLRSFALRARELQLARSTRVLMWILGIGMLLAIVGGVILSVVIGGTATPGSAPAPVGGGIAVGACGVTAIGAILFLWYVVLLVRYRRMLIRALEENRKINQPELETQGTKIKNQET